MRAILIYHLSWASASLCVTQVKNHFRDERSFHLCVFKSKGNGLFYFSKINPQRHRQQHSLWCQTTHCSANSSCWFLIPWKCSVLQVGFLLSPPGQPMLCLECPNILLGFLCSAHHLHWQSWREEFTAAEQMEIRCSISPSGFDSLLL